MDDDRLARWDWSSGLEVNSLSGRLGTAVSPLGCAVGFVLLLRRFINCNCNCKANGARGAYRSRLRNEFLEVDTSGRRRAAPEGRFGAVWAVRGEGEVGTRD